MDLTLLSLNIKVFEFELSLSLSLPLDLSESLSLSESLFSLSYLLPPAPHLYTARVHSGPETVKDESEPCNEMLIHVV